MTVVMNTIYYMKSLTFKNFVNRRKTFSYKIVNGPQCVSRSEGLSCGPGGRRKGQGAGTTPNSPVQGPLQNSVWNRSP